MNQNTHTFTHPKELAYKVYDDRNRLLLVTPTMANAIKLMPSFENGLKGLTGQRFCTLTGNRMEKHYL
jgi:hypothetical protein